MPFSSDRGLRLSRQVYRLRVLGLVVGGVAVATVLRDQHAPALAWGVLAVHVLAWPHVAWLLARRSPNAHAVERISLTIDSTFGGIWVAAMHFNLLPSFLIIAMMSMDKIGWGPAFLARTSLAMAAGCGVTAVLTGGAFEPATTMGEILASLPLMFAYPLAVAFASYRSGKLARERNRAIEQMAALREQLAHIGRVSTLGEMSAGLAHELHQPLTAIEFEAAAALGSDGDVATVEMRRALSMIRSHAERAADILRGMRTFARRAEPRREATDIRVLVREVMSLVAHDLRRNAIAASEGIDGDLPPVLVDRIEIEQVLVNLIRNAIEAMADTPPTERRLSIEARKAPNGVRVSVADSGAGVDPAIAPTLFHPFHSTKPTGMGLGLSICRSLVEAHGGTIGTRPCDTGRGAVFYFELPGA